MKKRSLAVLELLDRRRYGATNFLATFMGGSYQTARKEVGALAREGLLTLHSPRGGGDITRSYPDRFFRIYEKKGAHRYRADSFWHQFLTDAILISIETACKNFGLTFSDREHILGDKPLALPALDREIEPDALFAINGFYFALEADTGTEPLTRDTLKKQSIKKKLLQYRDVFKNRTYETWGVDNLKVLFVTTKRDRAQNMVALMNELKLTSQNILFASYPGLSSTDKAPQPILSILEDPMLRAGYPPYIIGMEVFNGSKTKKTEGAY